MKWPQFSRVVEMREAGPFGLKQNQQGDEFEPLTDALVLGYEPHPMGRVAKLC